MAKLSAHGYEVARLDVTRTVPDNEYRVVYSFRSDGHILRRIGTDTWKLYKRLKEPRREPCERVLSIARRWSADTSARSDSTVSELRIA